MSTTAPWDAFLREHFPAYLLPESHRERIEADEAARFLARLTGEPQQLRVLLAVSILAAHMEELREFALVQLPALVRVMTARAEVYHKLWEGGYQGRLDVQATLAHRLRGEATRFTTRARRRRFDLPEQVLVRATAQWLLRVLGELRHAGVLASYGWSKDAQACEGQLRHLLESTVLREVPEVRPETFHLRAAEMARHPCYGMARRWHLYLEGLHEKDPKRLSELLAEGALVPLEDHTRFELAVAIRLLQALEARLQEQQPGRWTLQRTLVLPGRKALAIFERDDGARIQLFYNQSELEPGPVEEGARYYLGHNGRMRPDLTLKVALPGGQERAVVMEVKHSANLQTLLAGYHEAHIYLAEYARWLTGWPKAILVVSGRITVGSRCGDAVVAVDWDRWVPVEMMEGMLAAL
jgi:hypothetical protein